MLESMFDQETVTRNEILRHSREAAEKATKIAEKKAEEAAEKARKEAEEDKKLAVNEAKEEAQARTASEIAANMLKDGVSDENVLAWSGISKLELEELKKKLEKEKEAQISG